ncbi:hypothetical protein D3C76_1091740 [compost metagenome]
MQGLEDLHLLVAYRFGLELCRWLHGHQAEQLQQVILQHVASGAGAIVVGAAVLYTEGFTDADLHMIDLVVAPHGLEQGIGEAQGHEVLHGFLAQVVIDTKHLRLGENGAEGLVDCRRRLQRVADRLFQHDARIVIGQACDFEVVGNWHEQVGCGGQVVDPGQAAGLTQKPCQTDKIGALRGVHGEVVEAGREARPDIFIEVGTGDLRPATAFGELEEFIAWQIAAGQGDDAHGGV